MKRIIVDGATSLVGVALIQAAIEEGIEVYAIIRRNSRRKDRLPQSRLVHILECNLNEFNGIKDVGCECDVYYHISWENTGKGSLHSPWKQHANIQYELDAVELARRCGCKKFVGAGSQAEFGVKQGKIRYDDKFDPDIAYGFSKLAAYGLSRELCKEYGLVHLWGRIFSLYGGNDIENTMLDYAINCFLSGKDAFFSSGTQLWDYLNEKDAGVMFLLMGKVCNESKAYNIAYGESRRLREFINILANEMGTLHLCHFNEDGADLQGLQADISEYIRDIGYTPQITFEEGIKEMIRIYKMGGYCINK